MRYSPKKSALSYFGVDYDIFQRRINKAIRRALLREFSTSSSSELREFQEAVGLKKDIASFMRGSSDKMWDTSEIERLACPLDIGVCDALNPLNVPKKDKAYWRERMRREQFVMGCPVELTTNYEIREGETPNRQTLLAFYLYFAVLDEINATTAKRREEIARTSKNVVPESI